VKVVHGGVLSVAFEVQVYLLIRASLSIRSRVLQEKHKKAVFQMLQVCFFIGIVMLTERRKSS
jgi:hypothetical protein